MGKTKIVPISSAPTDMRYSVDLCDEETDFRQKRKKVVYEAMKKLLGERGPKKVDEVIKSRHSRNTKMHQAPKEEK